MSSASGGPDHIFISHATKDDALVKELRCALEGQGLSVWDDSRNLRGGNKLAAEIERAIEQARQVLVVLSPQTVNSSWVRQEIRKAQAVEQQRKGAGKKDTGENGYRVIPLLLPGVEPPALALWFDQEPVAVPIRLGPGGLSEALPAILAALGERLPTDRQPSQEVNPHPVEELLLVLSDAKIKEEEGKRRAVATATLIYEPAAAGASRAESRRYTFTAPLGPIEADDLRWYLEKYSLWPTGVFRERAERIEAKLPTWGQDLYQAALGAAAARDILAAWENAAGGAGAGAGGRGSAGGGAGAGDSAERCFSVLVDKDLPDGAGREEQAAASEAATELLSLPWELLHDGIGYLFQGRHQVRVRRRLPNRRFQPVCVASLPVRILLVSPRPEDEQNGCGYIDHRISALPLVEAVESLGELAELTVLTPPTFPALQKALKEAQDAGQPFDVVHFDGHGVFDREHGLGSLCFEDPKDIHKIHGRAMQLIHADDLAAVMRDYRIPLVFLDACQGAKAEIDPTASVAARLLQEGVTSVVAMSHSVLVETARRFVRAFYEELAQGARVGQAMLAGQNALAGDTYRGKIMGAGELHLEDWFVPILYQEKHDPQLFTTLLPKEARKLREKQRRLSLGRLPDPPSHHFQGRSRELLALERLLPGHPPYAVVRGQGGIGKTTLTVELARWLVRTGRFQKAAFVSLEVYTDARGVLDSLGQQLLPEGEKWSVAHYPDLKQARQFVERALADYPTLIVLDNLESVLPDASGNAPAGTAPIGELFGLCQALITADPATRLLFTSREPLPAPFDHRGREVVLGALSREDAIRLVSQVMADEGLIPSPDDPGSKEQEINDLVEAVHCHPRALVLLAREVSRQGVRVTTQELHQLMAGLHEKYPDDRKKSLYASVELSLRRLPQQMREQVRALGVFHGGANGYVLGQMLGVDKDAVQELASALVEVGLGEDMGYGHLRLDPALAPYLLGSMSQAEREGLRARWVKGMKQLTYFLYEQQFKDAGLAAQLTPLELPNLLAMLEWVQDKAEPEKVVDLAGRVETMLVLLGRPQALAQAIIVLEQAAQALGEWGHARFEAEKHSICRLLERGDLQAAHTGALELLQHCMTAGEDAYPEAAYDLVIAQWMLGGTMRKIGAAETAIEPLTEAQQRFQKLADMGNTSAESMASAAITEKGDCLMALGRMDEAATEYEESIKRFEKLDDERRIATSKFQLGKVRCEQKRYAEALKIYAEVRKFFEALREPVLVADTWHETGMAHRMASQFEQAENAYWRALAIEVQQKYSVGEASSIDELGILYSTMGRLEEAVTFHRQAAGIRAKLGDLLTEGRSRNNLANILVKLKRYDEARRELLRAIECNKSYGHAAQPWNAWGLLQDLEQATGNHDAAAKARQQAIQCYLAYRCDGGVSQSPRAQLYALAAQAVQQGDTTEAEQYLAQLLAHPDAPRWLKALVSRLQAILKGDRNLALADDPNLDCRDAVELQLLLESLGAP